MAPARAYFEETCAGELAGQLALFRVCSLFDPLQAHERQPTLPDISEFAVVLPMVKASPALVMGLKEQLSAYLALSASTAALAAGGLHVWWANRWREQVIPAWVEVARYVLNLQPHSAGPERVFSRVKHSFGERQQRASQDIMEASIMSQMNNDEWK